MTSAPKLLGHISFNLACKWMLRFLHLFAYVCCVCLFARDVAEEWVEWVGMGVTTNWNSVVISSGHNHWNDSVIAKPNHPRDQPLCSREQITDLIEKITAQQGRWWAGAHYLEVILKFLPKDDNAMCGKLVGAWPRLHFSSTQHHLPFPFPTIMLKSGACFIQLWIHA